MAPLGAWVVIDEKPQALKSDRGFLEANLETWIEREPALVADGLRWYARQLRLPDQSILDLLGVTADGTWVIAELKRAPVGTSAIMQAMHYLVEIAPLAGKDLVDLIRGQRRLSEDDYAELADLVEGEEDPSERDYLILVIGIEHGESAERAAATLRQLGLSVQIRVLTFGVVKDLAGQRVLLREVEREAHPTPRPKQTWNAEKVRQRAADFGVADVYDELVGGLIERGLRTHARKYGVLLGRGGRINAFWVRPTKDGLDMGYLTSNFPEIFDVSEEDAQEALGPNWKNHDPSAARAVMGRWFGFLDGLPAPGAGSP